MSPPATTNSTLRSIGRFITKPRGDRRWDLLLRATALIALIGIPIILLFPDSAPLVFFTVASVPANSPLSPLTPVAFEPLIMETAKYAAPLAVASIALVVYLYTEYLNFHFYRWVLDRKRLVKLREHRWIERAVDHFARTPAVATCVFAFTPLPFWVVRILAIYHGYPLRRFMVATAIGRLPRYLIYAWLGGLLMVPSVFLAAVAVGATVLVVAVKLAKREALFRDEVIDAADAAESELEVAGEAVQ